MALLLFHVTPTFPPAPSLPLLSSLCSLPRLFCQVGCCHHSGVSGMPPDVFFIWLSQHTHIGTQSVFWTHFLFLCTLRAWSRHCFDPRWKSVFNLCTQIPLQWTDPGTTHVFFYFPAFSLEATNPNWHPNHASQQISHADPFLSLYFRVNTQPHTD